MGVHKMWHVAATWKHRTTNRAGAKNKGKSQRNALLIVKATADWSDDDSGGRRDGCTGRMRNAICNKLLNKSNLLPELGSICSTHVKRRRD